MNAATLAAQSPDSTLILSELVEEAIKNNPSLQAIQQNWQAAEARVPQASALPDPKLSFKVLNLPQNTFVFDQEPMTGKQFSLMQAFPFPGKLGLKEKIAGEGARISEFQFMEAQNQLKQKVKLIYYELFFLDKSIETNEKNAELIKQFTNIAETRYRVGKGLLQDVLKSQVEYSKITDNLIDLRQRRHTIKAEVNFLLNRPVENPIGLVEEASLVSFPFVLSDLKTIADKNLRQSNQKIQLAKKGYLPDFGIEFAYSQRDELQNGGKGVDFFSGMVSLNLPIYFWKKQKKNVEENQLLQKSVQHKLRSVEQMVYRDLETNLTDLLSNGRRVEFYRTTIIPQASQALQSALSAYQVDKVEFLTLVNNQMTLFNHELSYYKVLHDYLLNLVNLEFLVGKELIEMN
jgi:outer membrane protein TolC